MKTVGLIPFWMKDNQNREIKKLAGKYLIEYSIELLNSSSLVDETVIYATNDDILEYIDPHQDVSFIKRPAKLDNQNISTEEILQEFMKGYDADIIVLLHPYSPFIKTDTLNRSINMIKKENYDSAFTAQEHKKFSWFRDNPLNFKTNAPSPKISTLDPVITEEGLLYIITKEAFSKTNSRIGQNPYIKIIDQFESFEVVTKKDFELAELIINAGMFQGASK